MSAVRKIEKNYWGAVMDDDQCQQELDLDAIHNFLLKFRCDDRIFIPRDNLRDLEALFKSKVKLSLDFSIMNPLSTMETITLALSMYVKTGHIALILMSAPSTVETYIKRARQKLQVKTKYFALIEAIKQNYIQILH
jgi:DNA-binding NarL/FixJ family response regulator